MTVRVLVGVRTTVPREALTAIFPKFMSVVFAMAIAVMMAAVDDAVAVT